MRKALLPALLATAAVLVSACQGSSGGTSGTPTGSGGMNHGGMSTGAQISGKDLDKAFINGMAPHHQAAIQMAQAELKRGNNAQVNTLAQSIVDDQTREISQFQEISKRLFNTTPQLTMAGPSGSLMGVPISMDMSKMAAEIDAAQDPDVMFLRMMIPHHAMAILMANEEAQRGSDEQLKVISRSIISSQGKQIGQMQALLGSAGA
jgi:uncharacterized protein (DUF305 family)